MRLLIVLVVLGVSAFGQMFPPPSGVPVSGFSASVNTTTDTVTLTAGSARIGATIYDVVQSTAVGPTGAGNVYFSISSAGVLTAGKGAGISSAGTLTNIADGGNVTTPFWPADSIPLWVCTVASSNYDTCTDKRVALSTTAGIVPVLISSSGPVSPTATGFYFNDASGALTYNLPAITNSTVGMQLCFRNAVTRTGAMTLQAPASTYIGKDGANGAAAGTLVSSGALGDAACVVAISTTQYAAYVQSGSWTNN